MKNKDLIWFTSVWLFAIAIALLAYYRKPVKEVIEKPTPVIVYDISTIDSSELRMSGKYLYNLIPENQVIWDPNFWVGFSDKLVPGYDRFAMIVYKP